MSRKGGDTMHPNSLSNLRPNWDKETANEAREKGLETRRANKAAREAMKMPLAEYKKWKTEVIDEADLTAVDLMRIQMHRYMDEGDIDSAMDLAKTLAEFEQPKLARVDQTTEDVTGSDLSEEELDAKIRKLLKESDGESE